ncbi:MAG TPA: superoxide dismutase family protein, partial [Acidimicrobiales bacterium]|nr:superoxide dismutase family protein [Acidimicrobiales bacterium]
PGFGSANGHFNPAGADHGDHAGDLPPLTATGSGVARASFRTTRFAVDDLLDADGSALVVHAGRDNFANIPAARYNAGGVPGPDATTKATGDSGSRVLCGAVEEAEAVMADGLWLGAVDGGVFAVGNAPYEGNALESDYPVVGMAPDTTGRGYYLVAEDGGVFARAAAFGGSAAPLGLAEPATDMAVPTGHAYAILRDATGARVGHVTMGQESGGTRISVYAKGLTPGFHGFHAHSAGVCDAPFATAGPHFDGVGNDHANHVGDLPSLFAGSDGVARLTFVTPNFAIPDLFDSDGAAFIVHGGRDNFANILDARYDSVEGPVPDSTTKLSGDSGARSLCGVATYSGSGPTQGYWVTAADGGVFALGDAPFRGSAATLDLNAPVVSIASSPTGEGYLLAATDGGVFAFGDAVFAGSAATLSLAAPVISMTPTPTGQGYWLVALDGGVFAFGDAVFAGSLAGVALNAPITSIVRTASGAGYWLIGADGGTFAFGDARYVGGVADIVLNSPVLDAAAVPR